MRIGVGFGVLLFGLSAAVAQEVEIAGMAPLYSSSNPNQVVQAADAGTLLQLGAFVPRYGLYSVTAADASESSFLATAEALGLPPRTTFQTGEASPVEAFGKQGATYIAYLPASYRAEATPPLVFAFSPVGNAVRIVEVLRPVAEARGWVVVGCNGPRDGRDENFYPTVREIMLDVRRRIPHDRRREYLSGFSGGAMASYRLSRIYWDEFAGVLAFGGWLGLYDKDLSYPPRLAAALVNGRQDQGAGQYEKQDRKILQGFGIRSKVFRFDGGHEYPDTRTVLEAVSWLEEDWLKEGSRQAEPSRAASTGAEQLAQACRAQDPAPCGRAAMNGLLRHPQSSAVDAARFFLARAFARQRRGEALIPAPPADLSEHPAVILYGMFQGLSEVDRPLAWALLETAHSWNPQDARIGARLSLFVLQSDDPSVRDPERALQLAVQATGSGPDEWTAWFTRGLSEGALGRTEQARASLEKAYRLAPNWAQRMCRQALETL